MALKNFHGPLQSVPTVHVVPAVLRPLENRKEGLGNRPQWERTLRNGTCLPGWLFQLMHIRM